MAIFPNISDILPLKIINIPIADILNITKFYVNNDHNFIRKTSVTQDNFKTDFNDHVVFFCLMVLHVTY